MKTHQALVTACLATLVLLSTTWGEPAPSSAPPAVGETPPGIVAGKRLYWIETRSDALRGLVSTTPTEVLETRGAWVKIKSNAIGFGPVWLNFDEVVHYKTEL